MKDEKLKPFIIKGSNECKAINAIPSKECKEYHEKSCVQINIEGKTLYRRVDGTYPILESMLDT